MGKQPIFPTWKHSEARGALDQSLPYSLLQPNYFRNQGTLWPCIKAAKQIKGMCIIRFRLLVLAKISNPKLWRHLWLIKMRKNKRRFFSKFLWKKPITAGQKNRLLLAGCYYRANPVFHGIFYGISFFSSNTGLLEKLNVSWYCFFNALSHKTGLNKM